jgi:hypothetical protein
MYLVRDVFQCKPGKAKALVDKFKVTLPAMEKMDPKANPKIMTDFVSTYWTVVLQMEVESMDGFESHMREWGKQPGMRAAMEGYMDLVEGGHREIYRIE